MLCHRADTATVEMAAAEAMGSPSPSNARYLFAREAAAGSSRESPVSVMGTVTIRSIRSSRS
ncbi:MAG: hypothetical protein A4E67_00869 [Syntrophaceae bacterium PtaB.Bin038]|nr:MAG: hypothetical protein A4E67_00869 [Syntrophaceae bacterium PtaB.Bin038]